MNHQNVVRRVAMRGGWIGLLSGESQGKALERVIPAMNAEGYRVAFIIKDQFSWARRVLNLVIFAITLGFVGFVENLLIVGEAQGAAVTSAPPTPGA